MAGTWSFEYFRTTASSGEISARADVTSVVEDWSVEETVGDERYIIPGDISLKLSAALPFNASYHNWLLVSWEGESSGLWEQVYYIGREGGGNVHLYDRSYDSKDIKRDLYTVRLASIQRVFYDQMAAQVVEYSNNAAEWNYSLEYAFVDVNQIKRKMGGGSYTTPSGTRKVFNLLQMLTAQGYGGSRTNNHGYLLTVDTYSEMPDGTGAGNCLLFRADGNHPTTDTEQTIVEDTFGTDGEYNWLDVWKWASYAFNSFIDATPSITGSSPEYLSLTAKLVPRIAVTPPVFPNLTTSLWIERSVERYKFRVAGLTIEGGNFTYTNGDPNGENAVTRNVPFTDPATASDSYLTDLYLVEGTYDGGTGDFEIEDGSGDPVGWFQSSNPATYYDDMVTDGHGVSGRIKWAGERPLDVIWTENGSIHYTTIRVNRREFADVEGIIL